MAKPTRTQREAARKRLDEERARQRAADRRRNLVAAVVAVAVVALVLGIVWVGVSGEDDDYTEAARPAAVTEVGGGVPLAGADLPPVAADADVPTVEVFTDFLCPACATFEAQSGEALSDLVREEEARVVYHPMNLIGRNLGLDSSTRIGGASGCAADAGAFESFRDIAYANQPPYGEEVSHDEIVAWGEQTDMDRAALDEFEQCVRDDRYVDWVKQEYAAAGDRGITSTPTVLVDGRELRRDPDEYTPAGLRIAVAEAAGK